MIYVKIWQACKKYCFFFRYFSIIQVCERCWVKNISEAVLPRERAASGARKPASWCRRKTGRLCWRGSPGPVHDGCAQTGRHSVVVIDQSSSSQWHQVDGTENGPFLGTRESWTSHVPFLLSLPLPHSISLSFSVSLILHLSLSLSIDLSALRHSLFFSHSHSLSLPTPSSPLFSLSPNVSLLISIAPPSPPSLTLSLTLYLSISLSPSLKLLLFLFFPLAL